MLKKIFEYSFSAVLAVLLLWGVLRAATTNYAQRQQEVFKQCGLERERLGLSDTALRQKYPTPEIGFCKAIKVAPGGTGEVVVKGNFLPGTRFLFDNEKIQVVKEGLVGSDYHATIKVAQSSLPDYATVYSYQPVRCMTTSCPAVSITGKFAWDLTADNGWHIKLEPVDQPGGPTDRIASTYRAEFYRPGEAKPFEVRSVDLSCHEDECHGVVGEGTQDAALKQKAVQGMMNRSPAEQQQSQAAVKQAQAEMAQVQQQMQNFTKLSPDEQKALMARLQAASKKMADAMTPKATAEAQQEMEKNKQEFGCAGMSLSPKGAGLQGTMACGEKVGQRGQLKLTGNVKYLGP